MHTYENLPPSDGIIAALKAQELGSFTAAAEELGLTHTTISRRIAILEKWLGGAIFERLPRGVVLTPIGQRFLAASRQAAEIISNSMDRWKPRHRRTNIRVSIVPSFARLWLIPRLKDLQGSDLNIELILDHKTSEMNRREVDIAIRYGKGKYEDVSSALLFKEYLVPCASPAIAEALSENPSANDILSYPLINDSNQLHWQTWFAQFEIQYRARSIDRRLEDYDTVLSMAAAGLGIALLRMPISEKWIKRGEIVQLGRKSIINPLSHYLVWRKDENKPEIMELISRLKAAANH